MPPNKPVPAAGCPVLVAAPPPPPNAVHSMHQFHFIKTWTQECRHTHTTLYKLDLSTNDTIQTTNSTNRHTHTHTHTTVLRPFVWDYPGRPVPEETFTHSHPSWSSDILYHLPPSTTIYSILLVQFTCLTVLLSWHMMINEFGTTGILAVTHQKYTGCSWSSHRIRHQTAR